MKTLMSPCRRTVVLVGATVLIVSGAVAAVVLDGRSADTRGLPDVTATGAPSPTALPGSVLPGEEALVPPVPLPGVEAAVAELDTLGAGAAEGEVHLVLTGLAGFEEPVTGVCRPTGISDDVVALDLADGSSILVSVVSPGGVSVTVRMPTGEELVADLPSPRVDVESDRLQLDGYLLRHATSESFGTFALDVGCAA